MALPTFMFLFAVGVLCSLFVTKRKNEIHPPNQKTLCGKMDLHDPNNPNYQNVSHHHIFGTDFQKLLGKVVVIISNFKWEHEMGPDQCKPEFFTPTQIREYNCPRKFWNLMALFSN